MKKALIIFISTLLVGIIIGLSINSILPTGQAISNPERYSYTTAICNNGNECIDILINCQDNQVISIEPFSDLIKFDKEWQDLRDSVGNYC